MSKQRTNKAVLSQLKREKFTRENAIELIGILGEITSKLVNYHDAMRNINPELSYTLKQRLKGAGSTKISAFNRLYQIEITLKDYINTFEKKA